MAVSIKHTLRIEHQQELSTFAQHISTAAVFRCNLQAIWLSQQMRMYEFQDILLMALNLKVPPDDGDATWAPLNARCAWLAKEISKTATWLSNEARLQIGYRTEHLDSLVAWGKLAAYSSSKPSPLPIGQLKQLTPENLRGDLAPLADKSNADFNSATGICLLIFMVPDLTMP